MSCGETVAQNAKMDSNFLYSKALFRCFKTKPQEDREETNSPKKPFWTTVSPVSARLARSEANELAVPTFSGRLQTASRTLWDCSSEVLLIGRERGKDQSGKSPPKSGRYQEGQEKDKSG